MYGHPLDQIRKYTVKQAKIFYKHCLIDKLEKRRFEIIASSYSMVDKKAMDKTLKIMDRDISKAKKL